MGRAIPAGILRQILLVVVGALAFSCTEITWLSHRGQSTGRLLVDVDDGLPVDHDAIPLMQMSFDPEQPVASECFSASDSQVKRHGQVHKLVLSAPC